MSGQVLERRKSNSGVLDLADETMVIEFVAVTKSEEEKLGGHGGYGACSISGCYCQSYVGQGYTCENCGHNYGSHW